MAVEEEATRKFEIKKVADRFEKSLNEGKDDVELELFIAAYEELNKFIGMLGKIFQFVQKDVAQKTNALRSLLSSLPDEYRTVSAMFAYEVACKNYQGTKHLLALHRALEFISDFMSDITAANDNDSISEICRRSYERTLAKYHNWAIRKAVGLASYTLPTRINLLRFISDDKEVCEEYVKEVVANVVCHSQSAHGRILIYYDTHDLHHLI